MSGKKLLGKSK